MISDKVQQNAQKVEKGNRCTLCDEKSEAHAIIYIKALDDILAVTVDHALISDEEQHKKSDFLLWTFNSGNTHIIELKGKNVDAAFEQMQRLYKPWEKMMVQKNWSQEETYSMHI